MLYLVIYTFTFALSLYLTGYVLIKLFMLNLLSKKDRMSLSMKAPDKEVNIGSFDIFVLALSWSLFFFVCHLPQ